MNLEEKINLVNQDIQSFNPDNNQHSNFSFLNKLEELKRLMVSAYEKGEGFNKYMVRLPMWLIDTNVQEYKKYVSGKDHDITDRIIRECKKIANKAIELFEKACMEHNTHALAEEGF